MALSLRWYVPGLIIVFASVTAFTTYVWNTKNAMTAVELRVKDKIEHEMNQLQNNVEYFIRKQDFAQLQEQLASTVTDQDVTHVFFADESGKIKAATQRNWINQPMAIGDTFQGGLPALSAGELEKIKNSQSGEIKITPEQTAMLAYYPVQLTDLELGTVRPTKVGLIVARYDLTRRKAISKRQTEVQMAQFGGFSLGLATLLWAVFHFALTRRINRLDRAVKLMANGHLDVKSHVSGIDEIGQLGEAFNQMTRRLHSNFEEINASQKRFNQIFHAIPDMVFLVDLTNQTIISVNDHFCRILCVERDEIIGLSFSALDVWVKPGTYEALLGELRREGLVRNREVAMRTNIGKTIIASISADCIEIENRICALSVARDITESKQMESQIFEEKERLQVTLHSIGDAVITTDTKGLVDYLNPVAETLTGWSAAEANGRALYEIFNIVNEESRLPVESPVTRCLREGTIVGLANHTALINRNGSERAIEDTAAPIRNKRGEIIGAVLVFHDVSNSRQLATQLSWQASHDALTGLVNRREFERELSQLLLTAQAEHVNHALIYLDLDQFKVVNDTCGHSAGDELLRQLCAVMQSHLRECDMLARLGGDEFGILLKHCALENAIVKAERLLQLIRNFRFVWENRTFEIGASIGLVPVHEESGLISAVMSKADLACYAAKEQGRNRIHVFKESDEELKVRHGEMQWVSRITDALNEDRFVLFMQRISPVSQHEGLPVHYEVLLRMQDESGNIIAPATFLPAAERYGLMPAVDRWVISATLSMLAAATEDTHKSAHEPLSVYCINLSGASLSEDHFLEFFREKLQQSMLPPQKICIEITETTAISHLAKTSEFMSQLKSEMGCSFALDDFGSGVSSFAYLKRLPVDYLKIDGAFVREMLNDPIDRAMINAINTIGHVMGIKTIAEYVENDSILEELKSIGVDFVQGYAIDKPKAMEV